VKGEEMANILHFKPGNMSRMELAYAAKNLVDGLEKHFPDEKYVIMFGDGELLKVDGNATIVAFDGMTYSANEVIRILREHKAKQ
jgi:hypothetical protein